MTPSGWMVAILTGVGALIGLAAGEPLKGTAAGFGTAVAVVLILWEMR